MSISQRHFVLQEQQQPCHHRNDRQVVKATFSMRLNILMRFRSFLGVCHNLCSEFVLDIGRLKEISTTFRNSMKLLWILLLTSTKCAIITRVLILNLIGHFCKFVTFSKMLARFQTSISQYCGITYAPVGAVQ